MTTSPNPQNRPQNHPQNRPQRGSQNRGKTAPKPGAEIYPPYPLEADAGHEGPLSLPPLGLGDPAGVYSYTSASVCLAPPAVAELPHFLLPPGLGEVAPTHRSCVHSDFLAPIPESWPPELDPRASRAPRSVEIVWPAAGILGTDELGHRGGPSGFTLTKRPLAPRCAKSASQVTGISDRRPIATPNQSRPPLPSRRRGYVSITRRPERSSQ